MSLIPAFEIGVWNAWILILGLGLINYGLGFLIAKESMLSTWPVYNQKEKNTEAQNMDTKQIAISELTETCERLQWLLQFKLPKSARKEIIQAIDIIKEFGIKELK